ncbi:MAG: hypothetical protein ACOCXQ_02025 [Patescibacteria group bacterium]
MPKITISLIPEHIHTESGKLYYVSFSQQVNLIFQHMSGFLFVLLPYVGYAYAFFLWEVSGKTVLMIAIWRLIGAHMACLFQYVKIALNETRVTNDVKFRKRGQSHPKVYDGTLGQLKWKVVGHFTLLYILSHYIVGTLPFLLVSWEDLVVQDFVRYGLLFSLGYQVVDLAKYVITGDNRRISLGTLYDLPIRKIASLIFGGFYAALYSGAILLIDNVMLIPQSGFIMIIGVSVILIWNFFAEDIGTYTLYILGDVREHELKKKARHF